MARTKRYSAKLLFEFLHTGNGKTRRSAVCAERIFVIKSENARKAILKANAFGKRYSNREVKIKFVGIVELLCMDIFDKDEAWNELFDRRKIADLAKRIPPIDQLDAVLDETKPQLVGNNKKKRDKIKP